MRNFSAVKDVCETVENVNMGFITETNANKLILETMAHITKGDERDVVRDMLSRYEDALKVVNEVRGYVLGISLLAKALNSENKEM